MALASVNINRNATGIGRVQASNDGISGFLFFNTLPTGFDSSGVEVIYSLSQAEGVGITVAARPIEHYHISEFFRINPNGKLWVGYSGSTTVDFTFLTTIQNTAGGEIRQFGVYTQDLFNASMAADAQSAADTLEADKQPASILLTADVYDDGGTTYQAGISDLPDISDAGHPNVSVFIGQAKDGTGGDLFTSNNVTIGCVGAALGAVSIAAVHESIAWPGKFDIIGGDFGPIGIGTQDTFEDLTPAQKTSVNGKGYILLRGFPGTSGVHFSDSITLESSTDFYSIERVRTIDKIARIANAVLTPKLNSPLYLEDDGTLNASTIQSFIEDLNLGVQPMDGSEVSAIEFDIDPAQDVLSTDKIEVSAKVVPVGKASTIVFNLTFVANL